MNGHRPGRGNPTREQNPAYGLLQPIFEWNHVDDQQRWDQAVKAADSDYEGLDSATRAQLAVLIGQIMRLKEGLVDQVLAAGSASICRECAGQCCLNGKYHVSVLDLLAYRIEGAEPVVPDFTAVPACPYSGTAGCRMPPRFRPMTCVVFNCELVEERVGQDERAALCATENLLREAIAQANRVAGRRLDRALLLSCDT
jgi:hypothetical protein